MHLHLGRKLSLLFHLSEELKQWCQGQRWSRLEQLSGHRIRPACLVRQYFGELAYGQRLKVYVCMYVCMYFFPRVVALGALWLVS